jgi:hypothetical protein
VHDESEDDDIDLEYIATNLIVDSNINVSNVTLETFTVNMVTQLEESLLES